MVCGGGRFGSQPGDALSPRCSDLSKRTDKTGPRIPSFRRRPRRRRKCRRGRLDDVGNRRSRPHPRAPSPSPKYLAFRWPTSRSTRTNRCRAIRSRRSNPRCISRCRPQTKSTRRRLRPRHEYVARRPARSPIAPRRPRPIFPSRRLRGISVISGQGAARSISLPPFSLYKTRP